MTEIIDDCLVAIPIFKGDKSSYPSWLRRFASACKVQDCAYALEPSHADALPSRTDSTLTEAETKAVKENSAAMRLLIIALEGDVLGMFIVNSYTTEYPLGVAWKVMTALDNRYNPYGIERPLSATERGPNRIDIAINFTKEMDSVSMNRREHPGNMIAKLKAISARYTILGMNVAQEELIARALVAAHDDYNVVLASARCAKGEDLTLEDVRSYMVALYELTYEYGQAAAGKSKRSRKSGRRKWRDVCGCCGKKGHDDITCWFKPGNKVPDHAILVLQKELENLRAASVHQSGVKPGKELML
jgi:hypothetical protein